MNSDTTVRDDASHHLTLVTQPNSSQDKSTSTNISTARNTNTIVSSIRPPTMMNRTNTTKLTSSSSPHRLSPASSSSSFSPLLSPRALLEETKRHIMPVILQNAQRRSSGTADLELIREKLSPLMTDRNLTEFIKLAHRVQGELSTKDAEEVKEARKSETKDTDVKEARLVAKLEEHKVITEATTRQNDVDVSVAAGKERQDDHQKADSKPGPTGPAGDTVETIVGTSSTKDDASGLPQLGQEETMKVVGDTSFGRPVLLEGICPGPSPPSQSENQENGGEGPVVQNDSEKRKEELLGYGRPEQSTTETGQEVKRISCSPDRPATTPENSPPVLTGTKRTRDDGDEGSLASGDRTDGRPSKVPRSEHSSSSPSTKDDSSKLHQGGQPPEADRPAGPDRERETPPKMTGTISVALPVVAVTEKSLEPKVSANQESIAATVPTDSAQDITMEAPNKGLDADPNTRLQETPRMEKECPTVKILTVDSRKSPSNGVAVADVRLSQESKQDQTVEEKEINKQVSYTDNVENAQGMLDSSSSMDLDSDPSLSTLPSTSMITVEAQVLSTVDVSAPVSFLSCNSKVAYQMNVLIRCLRMSRNMGKVMMALKNSPGWKWTRMWMWTHLLTWNSTVITP